MIPRKKLQILLYTLHILCVFGDGGTYASSTTVTATASSLTTTIENETATSSSSRSSLSKTTEPIEYSNTISSDDDTIELFTKSTPASNGSSSLATKTYCTVPGAVINLTYDSSTLLLTWDPPSDNPTCMIYYSVKICQSNDCSIGNTTNTSYTASNLSPCLNYTFTVTAVGDSGESDANSITVTTAYVTIPAVQNLSAVGMEYGLNITWDVPSEINCVSGYRIDVSYKYGDTQIYTTNSTYFTLTNLKACIAYTLEVVPVSDEETSGANTTIIGKTSSSVPGAVINLTYDSSTLLLTWDPPSDNPTCVIYYSVKICQSNDCSMGNTTNTSYTASNLSPCLTYTFTVTAVGDSGESDANSITVTTAYVRPSSPSSLKAIPGDFSLNVTWDPPSTGATCVSQYRVNVWEGATVTTTNTFSLMTGLYACTSYTVQVTPISTTSGDGEFGIVTQTTAETVTNPPELYIDPTVTESTISMGWTVESYMNKCELISVITVCNFTGTDGHGYTMVNGESTDKIDGTSTNVTANITVANLSPYTSYSCRGITVNSAGRSVEGSPVIAMTSEDLPSAPVLGISSITDTSFTFNWTEPSYLPGSLRNYEIVISWKPLFLIPDWCTAITTTTDTVSDIGSTDLSIIYENGTSYSSYTAMIRAKTGAGWGDYSDSIEFQTEPSVSGPITNLTYSNETNAEDPNVLDTTLSWSLPCSSNGVIEYFYVSVYGTREGFLNESITNTTYVSQDIDANQVFVLDFGELQAEYYYVFEVSAKVVGVTALGTMTNYTVLYPAGIPDLPNQTYIDSITIDPLKAQRTTTTASILLPLFPNTSGEILYYAIMISESGHSSAERRRFNIRGGYWPNETAWREAMSYDHVLPYQATTIRWDPYSTNYVADYGHLKAVKYLLGEDSTCKALTANTDGKLYCNGPLKPGTWYHVRMRGFTNGGYADSVAFLVKTDAEMNVALVIGVVSGILLLGIATTMMLLIRRRGFLQTIVQKLNCSDILPASPFPAPLTRSKFIVYCQQLADNPGRLSNEFQLLQTISTDLLMETRVASLQVNRKKNRYTDILPYDFSRVKLDIIDNDDTTDYINASLVNGFSGEVEYIACQGPKEETTYDFWRMIDQYDVKVIVMVTQLVEKGKEKCHQYYPELGNTFEYEDMMIRCSSNLDHGAYRRRTFVLQKDNLKKHIVHLHFKEWPDHDVPDDYNSMIDFCQVVRKQIEANKSLAVVHCSAGVGRTGTLMAVDIMLQQIREGKKLDVFGTVYKLRRFRFNMVQRESQYAYIYNCTRQALKNPFLLKTYKPPPIDPIYENLPLHKMGKYSNSKKNISNSMETLRRSSPSTSVDSMEPIYEPASPRPSYRSQISTLSNGLRHSRSTSAIECKPSKIQRVVKYSCKDFAFDKPAKSSELNEDSDELKDLSGSRSSTYENLPTLTRSRSAHIPKTSSLKDTSI